MSAATDQVRQPLGPGTEFQVWGAINTYGGLWDTFYVREVRISDSAGNAVVLSDRVTMDPQLEDAQEVPYASYVTGKPVIPEGTAAGGYVCVGGDGDDDFTVTLDWGDGSPLETSFSETSNCKAPVSHRYAEEGTYYVVVTAAGATGTRVEKTTVQVVPVVPVVSVLKPSITAGVGFNGVIGTFNEESDLSGAPADDDYTATVSWGDGTTSPGFVHAGTVTASHTYARSGTRLVTVSIVYTPEQGSPFTVNEHGMVTVTR